MPRKTVPISKRAAIWRAHERRCIYCTELLSFADLDVDHIIPDHLREKPEQLAKNLNEYGVSNNFDLDSLYNLVPSHRHCNLQKRGQVLSKSRALHFLSIAEGRYAKAARIESEIRKQSLNDKFTVLLQVALEEGRLSLEELSSLMARYTESQNMFEVLTAFPFIDSELKGFLSSTDVDSIYERPILPRRHGLAKLTMVKATLTGKEMIKVCTCREWVEAIRDDFRVLSNYDYHEEGFFKNVYALVVALAQAKIPKNRFITDQKVSISNFDLLPVTLLPTLNKDDTEELQRFESDGIHILELIAQGRVKIVSSSPLSLTLYYGHMGLYMYEILRADLNDDGIEDLLIGYNKWALGGSFSVGIPLALTRLGIDQPFTITENIELNVRAT